MDKAKRGADNYEISLCFAKTNISTFINVSLGYTRSWLH